MSILENNKTKLQAALELAPPLHYPVFDSYLIECEPTDYPNSQLYRNTNELRYLLEKIKRGSLEDIYPPLFTNNISISDTLSLSSQLDILFESGVSIEEIIELLSQFNINFDNNISLSNITSLLSTINLTLQSNLTIQEIIELLSQFNIDFNNEINLSDIVNLLSTISLTLSSNLTIQEIIELLSQFNINFENNINLETITTLISNLNIMFNSNLNVEEAINLFSQINLTLNNSITLDSINNIILNLNILFESGITIDETINLISQCQITFNNDISIYNFIQLLSSLTILFNSGLSVEEALDLISNFNIILENNVVMNSNNNLLSQFNILCSSNIEIIKEIYSSLELNGTQYLSIPLDISSSYESMRLELNFTPEYNFITSSQYILYIPYFFNWSDPSLKIYLAPWEGYGYYVKISTPGGTITSNGFVTTTKIKLEIDIKPASNKIVANINGTDYSQTLPAGTTVEISDNLQLFYINKKAQLFQGTIQTTDQSYWLCLVGIVNAYETVLLKLSPGTNYGVLGFFDTAKDSDFQYNTFYPLNYIFKDSIKVNILDTFIDTKYSYSDRIEINIYDEVI